MWLRRWRILKNNTFLHRITDFFRKRRIRRLEKERDRCVLAEVFWQKKCRENPDILWYKSQLRKSIRRYRMIDEQIEKLKG